MTVQVREHQKTPLWRNATVLKWVAQLFVLAVVLAIFALLVSQALTNFAESDISFGWGWMSSPTGVQIREGIDVEGMKQGAMEKVNESIGKGLKGLTDRLQN